MSVFEEACYLSNQRWISSFPAEFEEVEFSRRHQKRMNILFDKMRRDKYHRLTKRATVALIAAIFIVTMTVTAFAIPVTRDYIIHKLFDHSTYTVVDGEDNEVGEITIGYIPEGFEKTYEHISTEEINYYYLSEKTNEWVNIKVMPLDEKIDIDTEHQEPEFISLGGIEYVLFNNNYALGCLWNDGEYTYLIIGNVSREMIFNIAQSIEK